MLSVANRILNFCRLYFVLSEIKEMKNKYVLRYLCTPFGSIAFTLIPFKGVLVELESSRGQKKSSFKVYCCKTRLKQRKRVVLFYYQDITNFSEDNNFVVVMLRENDLQFLSFQPSFVKCDIRVFLWQIINLQQLNYLFPFGIV